MLIAPQLSLAPDEANSWPPAGDVVLKAPKTVMIGQRVCEGGSDGDSSSGILMNGGRAVSQQMPQRGLLEGLGMSAADAAAAVACTGSNVSSSSDSGQLDPHARLAQYPMLDWAQAASLLRLQPAGSAGVLQLNLLTLLGLSQGPGVGVNAASGGASVGRRLKTTAAAAARGHFGSSSAGWVRYQHDGSECVARLQSYQQRQQQVLHRQAGLSFSRTLAAADGSSGGSSGSSSAGLTLADARVWSHLVWAVQRAGSGQLMLRGVSLGLPKPEFERLLAASRAAPGGAFRIPLEGARGAHRGVFAWVGLLTGSIACTLARGSRSELRMNLVGVLCVVPGGIAGQYKAAKLTGRMCSSIVCRRALLRYLSSVACCSAAPTASNMACCHTDAACHPCCCPS